MAAEVIPFPRRGPGPDPDHAPGFAELTRARGQAEALVIRGLLEAHGLRVVLRTHVAPSVHPFTVGDQGEVRILVPRASLPEGQRLLARYASGPSGP
jgi:hypothetical protein